MKLKRSNGLWEVMVSKPTRHEEVSIKLRFFVVTTTAERAMEMVRRDHPGCVFRKIAHYGSGSVIVDHEAER